MKMTKKMRTALTVAVIAGTCALSSPSFAAWESDAPTKLGTDITASCADEANGLAIVGQDGKAYHMTADKMKASGGQVEWTQVFPPVATDFVDITNNGDFFWAVTAGGDIATSQTGRQGSWNTINLPSAVKDVFNGKKVTGITRCQDDQGQAKDVVIIATDGTALYYDASVGGNAAWSSIGSSLSAESIAGNNRIIGVAPIPGAAETVAVFGSGGGAGNADNLYKLQKDTGILGFNVENCPAINDMSIQKKDLWYAVGDSATIIKGVQDLTAMGPAIQTPKLAITGTSATPNLLSIAYNYDETFGYAAGADGSLFRISGNEVTFKAQSETANDLNAVSLVEGPNGLRRAFVSGNDGASLYADETFWDNVSSTAVASAPERPRSILALGGRYYMADNADNSLSYTADPGSGWTKLNSKSAQPFNTGVSAAAAIGADNYIAVANYSDTSGGGIGNKGRVTIFKTSGASDQNVMFTAVDSSLDVVAFMATQKDPSDNQILYLAPRDLNKKVHYLNMDATGGSPQPAVGDIFANRVSGMAASSHGLYVVQGGEIHAMSGQSDSLLTIQPVSTNKWRKADAINTTVGTSTLLFQTGDDRVLCVNTQGKIYIFEDSQGASIAEISCRDLSYPGESPTYISGTSNDFAVATQDDVWRYTSAGGWEKYDSLDQAVQGMLHVFGVAAIGKNILASDYSRNVIAYSTGNEFNPALPEDAPAIGSAIISAYNATKADVYVAGENGLLYHGNRQSDSSSFDWTRENNGTFRAWRILKVTGSGEHVFTAFWDGSSTSFATKELSDSGWTHLSGSISGVINDAKGLSATSVMVVDGGALKKGTIDTQLDTISFESLAGTQSSADISGVTFRALDILGSELMYAVSGTDLYKFSEPSGSTWTIDKIALTGVPAGGLQDVFIQDSEKIYIIGDEGYAAFYDGSSVTNIGVPPSSDNLTSCWAYGEVMYASTDSGQVHEYNAKSKEWTTGTVKSGVALHDITGSQKGSWILVVGDSNTSVRNSISSGGGGQTSTKIQPGDGEDGDLVLQSIVTDKTAEELSDVYKTPAMDVMSEEQTFTSKTGLTAGSVHSFLFNVTPDSEMPVRDVKLYKLFATSGGSFLTYNRVDSTPDPKIDGTFWIVEEKTGNVMQTADTLAANTVYTVNFSIKDGGEYDSDNLVNGQIKDPTVLGATSGSGGSGCVFNPVQTFGMEWLMLAFAPLAAFFRSRFKK